MCGIAFVYNPELPDAALTRCMARARTCMTPRGPDHAGQYAQSPWCIGHQRLAVIDPNGSHQPISDPSGRYHLSYNGELYNYREVRNRLKDQWDFQTSGDAEVVLAGLCTIGADFLHLMEGMWALALWDQSARTLLLVRDRMGKKPLYYCRNDAGLACASDLRALNALSTSKWQEDAHSTADYFRYGFYLPGTTAFRGVYEVLPAHWLRWSPGRRIKTRSYWKLSPNGFNGTQASAAAMINEAFYDSVRLRMVADVEVGALLSGGIDSSLVVCAMGRHQDKPIQTFTIGFDQATYDERRYARALSGYCRTIHHEQVLRWNHSEELADSVLHQVAQPFGDASLLPSGMVSRMASQHLKVVLSGDGGDELFGGYGRYLARSCLRWLTRLPRQDKECISRWTDSLSKVGISENLLKYIVRIADMIRRMEDETPYVAPLNFDRSGLQQLLPDLWRKGHPAPNLPTVTKLDEIQQMMVADALIYLPQDILTKMDRAGMAHSLEVRSPFLDRRVVELAYALPRRWHRRRGRGKWMLRSAFGEILPDWIWERPKRGFAVPLGDWFRNGLQHRLNGLLTASHHPLSNSFVRKLISEHLSGRYNHGMRLWQIYIYLRWRTMDPISFKAILPPKEA